MKNKIIVVFMIIITSLLFTMCGTKNSNDNIGQVSVYDGTITLHNMNYNEESNIYDVNYQKELLNQVKKLKKSEKFTLDNPLVIINPFETNTTGIYLYFKTDKKSYAEYNVHINVDEDEDEIVDFSRVLYNGKRDNFTKEHEYTLIGGVAGKENIITINLYDEKSNLYAAKTFKITLPELDEGSDYVLTKEDGVSTEELSDGLFVTMGHINNEFKNSNTYYYDNDGICRAQIKLDGYRIDNMHFKDDLMYISVDTNKIAAVNRLGYVEKVYDLGQYEMHHDLIFGNKNDMLVLASNTESDSKEDIILSVNLKKGTVKEIIDLGSLFPDIKEKAVIPEGSAKLDWIHVNSIELEDNNTILISSRELSTIINITDIYMNPKVKYLISDKAIWQDTDYYDLVFDKTEDFKDHGGQHSLNVVHDDSLDEGQYYLYFYNNNTGVSSYYPDYEWVQPRSEDNDSPSMYYKYLIDENEKTYSLVKEIVLPPSRYISSVQEYKNHIITDSGQSYTICEFDSNDELIAQFTIEEKMWGLYRTFKHDFNNFYFYDKQ
ncbi:MAG: aryl-sulfate sulfotransferase [Clostridium sp.]